MTPSQAPDLDETPHVVAESVLDIGPCKLRCYVLSDGRRIFDAKDLEVFFGPAWAEIQEHLQALK